MLNFSTKYIKLSKLKQYLGIIVVLSCGIFIFSTRTLLFFHWTKTKFGPPTLERTSPFWKQFCGGKWSRDRYLQWGISTAVSQSRARSLFTYFRFYIIKNHLIILLYFFLAWVDRNIWTRKASTLTSYGGTNSYFLQWLSLAVFWPMYSFGEWKKTNNLPSIFPRFFTLAQ